MPQFCSFLFILKLCYSLMKILQSSLDFYLIFFPYLSWIHLQERLNRRQELWKSRISENSGSKPTLYLILLFSFCNIEPIVLWQPFASNKRQVDRFIKSTKIFRRYSLRRSHPYVDNRLILITCLCVSRIKIFSSLVLSNNLKTVLYMSNGMGVKWNNLMLTKYVYIKHGESKSS